MRICLISFASAVVVMVLCSPTGAADLEKVDRKIAKEPAYTAKQPLYGLLVFGPERTTRSGWCSTNQSPRFLALRRFVHRPERQRRPD